MDIAWKPLLQLGHMLQPIRVCSCTERGVAVARCINTLAAVFRELNKINTSISQILTDNFQSLGSDKSHGLEIMISFGYFISLNTDMGDKYIYFLILTFEMGSLSWLSQRLESGICIKHIK